MIQRMAKPFRGEVTLADGTRWNERDFLAVAGGTIDQMGLGFRPFHRFEEKPEQFHILGIFTSPLGFVRDMPRVWRGEPMREGKAIDGVTSAATIRSADGIMRYMIDGDLHETSGDLHVAIGPRVKIVVGT
jgi:hypothetical protein